jgi:hypothetical protein
MSEQTKKSIKIDAHVLPMIEELREVAGLRSSTRTIAALVELAHQNPEVLSSFIKSCRKSAVASLQAAG